MTIFNRKITDEDMFNIASYMDDEIREHLHFELAPCSNEEFLKRYLELDPEFEELLENEFRFARQIERRNTMSRPYEQAAADFCEAIKLLAERPDRLANLESYLEFHFGAWLEKYAGTPDGLASELQCFANME